MPVPEFIRRIRPDPYILAILAAVALAIALPVHGAILPAFSIATKLAVALLFFLYGARLPTEAVIAGLKHWRLHALTLSITFIAYPLISLAWPFMPARILAPPLLAGMTYLMCLPSTIQSSVALVASARGDVAAAVCSASLSNIIGVFLAPALVAILMHAQGATVSPQAVRSILIQLLIPFIAGQLAHRWLGAALTRFKTALTAYDRFTIMLIVYGAFSAAMVGGVWKQVEPLQLIALVILCAALFALIMTLAIVSARRLGFKTEDEIVVAFCGTQKGMAAGVPMAALIFPAPQVGLILLPVLVYHQLQLIACAAMASRYNQRTN